MADRLSPDPSHHPQQASHITQHALQVDLAVVIGLFSVVLLLYAPSLRYPFVWYDADDLLRAIKYSTLNLFTGVASYQYYRPLIFLFWKLILNTWEADSAPIFHAYLIGAHLLNSVLLYALARALTRRRSIAAVAAFLFVVYPFSYQAVTWIIAHQPPGMVFVLAGLLIYTQTRLKQQAPSIISRRRSAVIRHFFAIACFIAAMLMHESAFVGAGIVVLIEAYLVLTRRVPRLSRWPLVYIAVTVVMVVIYSSAAKSSPPQATFQMMTGLYLLQGLVYPIAMLLARVCQWAGCDSVAWLLPVSIATLIGLFLIWRSNKTILSGLLGVLWFGLGVAPMWAERDFIYNEYAPRLLYLAGAGASLAMAAMVGRPGEPARQRIRARPVVQLGLIGLIVWQSGQFVIARQALYDDAFRLLDQENRAMFAPRQGSVLFINTVELFTYKEAEFPLGWFGVLVSPWHNRIVTDKNLRAQNADWVIDPAHAQQVQGRSRLKLEFHGRVLSPDQLRAAIAGASEVYRVDVLTRPGPNPSPTETDPVKAGDLHLFKIAAIEHHVDPSTSFVAKWGNSIRLITASIEIEANTPVLNLDWSVDGPIDPSQTVFIHIQDAAGTTVAQADGDPIGGYAPLGSWAAADLIRERRPLILPADLPAGHYTVAVGLYDRTSLQRTHPAQANVAVTDAALSVTTFELR